MRNYNVEIRLANKDAVIYTHIYSSTPTPKIRYTQDMEEQARSGYREIEHTADWELEVWGPDMAALVEQAALGMYSLCGVRLKKDSRVTRQFFLFTFEPEFMLVWFLEELLWILEDDKVAFESFKMSVDGNVILADLVGAEVESLNKEIKAVTYHNLEIKRGVRGLEVRIVFDV